MSRKAEMLAEIEYAKTDGVTHIWYGHADNAEPIAIDDAIADIKLMDEDVIGDGTWGEYPGKIWPVLDRGTHDPNGDEVEIAKLEVFDEAYPTSRCLGMSDDHWATAEYIERMYSPKTGKQYDVVYLFDDDDMQDVDGEPLEEENFPWDEDHIARVFAVYDDER